MRKLVVGVLLFTALFTAACSSGPAAPSVSSTETVCNEQFCVDVPEGWTAEIGDSYLSFHHEIDPDNTFLTVGAADLEAIVEAAGGAWPVPVDEVVTSFWSLLEAADAGKFIRSTRLVGGAIKSWGTHVDGDMWVLIKATEGSNGVLIEMRAPNDSWEAHADVVFESLTIVG